METPTPIRLTQYSHGAGCGCKIAPAVLDAILAASAPTIPPATLLVGHAERDDAAVMDLGDGTAIISTTDFFMPIVDDAFDFGRIASVNAISDVYAMGGRPLMAIAILGWPLDKLPPELAGRVLEGARQACTDAGIPLAGGHSIDAPEPIFGLAVTGRVPIANLKKNGGAAVGDLLYLTKGLGVGILTTAEKKGLLRPADRQTAAKSMMRLNDLGMALGEKPWVHALTDVTGFGLLGHASEMASASSTTALIDPAAVPVLPAVMDYLELGAVPGGTHRNLDSYGHSIGPMPDQLRLLLADPQTSGGLLVAVDPNHAGEFEALAAGLKPIGRMDAASEFLVALATPEK